MPSVKVSHGRHFKVLKVDGLGVAEIDRLIKKTKAELKQKAEHEDPDHS